MWPGLLVFVWVGFVGFVSLGTKRTAPIVVVVDIYGIAHRLYLLIGSLTIITLQTALFLLLITL